LAASFKYNFFLTYLNSLQYEAPKKGNISDRFMHLTNYSVNKKSKHFSENDDADACEGHKWGLMALMAFLHAEHGVDPAVVWAGIHDVVMKTLLSVDGIINSGTKCHAKHAGVVLVKPSGFLKRKNLTRFLNEFWQARVVWF
jgi:hypothetical protein